MHGLRVRWLIWLALHKIASALRAHWLLWVALQLQGCTAAVYQLDGVSPWVYSNGRQVEWSRGYDAFLVASSACVRVNSRGLYTKPAHWTPRQLDQHHWITFPSTPDPDSLASYAHGRLFPSEAARFNPRTLERLSLQACTGMDTSRRLTADDMYDFTTCDVLHAQTDVLQCGRTVSLKNTAVPEWLYWVLCLLAVFLVRAFSHRVAQFTAKDRDTPAQQLQIDAPTQLKIWGIRTDTAVAAVCAIICVLCVIPPGADAMVTEEELNTFVFLIVYIACYIVAYACSGPNTDPPVYNMIAATIQLIVIRLYCGTHTPYNPVLLWAVSTRSIYKLRYQFSVTSACSILLDSVLLALTCTYGFETHFAYLFIAFAAALCTADLALEQTA